jgi:hypothetical protein
MVACSYRSEEDVMGLIVSQVDRGSWYRLSKDDIANNLRLIYASKGEVSGQHYPINIYQEFGV